MRLDRYFFAPALALAAALLLSASSIEAAQGGAGVVAPPRPPSQPSQPNQAASNPALPADACAKLRARQSDLYAKAAPAAKDLARWCGANNFAAGQRDAVRAALRLGGRDSGLASTLTRLDALPLSDAPPPDGYAREAAKLAQAAAPLYELWQDARKAGALSIAAEVAQDLAAADPAHEPTHQALGYVRHGGTWVGPWAKKMLGEGWIEDPQFGWIPAADAPKYRAGQRPLDGGGFAPKAQADAAHRDKAKPYKIVSEHFDVFSTRPLEEGVRFAREAEDFFASWGHHFAAFLEPELKDGALPGAGLRAPARMSVFYLFDEAQYRETSGNPRAKGHFDLARQCSFFYPYGAARSRVQEMIFYHEVGHQVFHAFSLGGNKGMGFYGALSGANNWLLEGLATYLEGLDNVGGKLVPAQVNLPLRDFLSSAGLASDRLAVIGPLRIKLAAHYVQAKIAEPWEKLFALNQAQYPAGPVVNNQQIDRYSEGGAIAYFLLHGSGERHRDAFARFVRAFYEGKARGAKAIEQYLGTPVAELEKAYAEFMAKIPPMK